MCCTRLAGNTGRKNDAKNSHLRTIAQLCRAISSQIRHISTIGKNLLRSNISPICPYNMVNFGPLAADIVSLVWGTTANYGVCILAALLHSQTAALNRGCHLYSAGRPSRWALAHISSFINVCTKIRTTKKSLLRGCEQFIVLHSSLNGQTDQFSGPRIEQSFRCVCSCVCLQTIIFQLHDV